jgi:rhamnose utilization protein RhaD (predicted bifunctional aldolase and dehydrogenase)
MSDVAGLRFVDDLWDDAAAAGLDPVGRLVYRSNRLGADPRVTNTGGGNTSSKVTESDPLTGEPVEVLWVKGSGGDLRTSTRTHFASLDQGKLLGLQKTYAARPDRGPKSPAEDDMVGLYAHRTFNLNPRAASIDTPLHAFVPRRCVDHTHPSAVIALAASAAAERLTREVYGDEVAYAPWLRPGFELGLRMQRIAREHPGARGVLLGSTASSTGPTTTAPATAPPWS